MVPPKDIIDIGISSFDVIGTPVKHSTFCVLSAVLLAGAAGTANAQHEHHGMAHNIATGVKLDVQSDAAAQVVALRVGPLNLPARTDHMEVAQAPDQFWTVPFDGWLVAYHPRLVDDAGRPVPGRLLHHVAFWNTRRSDFLCPNKEEHVFGAGGEMNDWPAILGYGYRVARGERIRIGTMFHNPTDTPLSPDLSRGPRRVPLGPGRGRAAEERLSQVD